ncbi:MAG: type II secretion system protein [Elusimicrobia bacterium]|nr:type II secretion system protein [Elusimicrobiota bacterium]
MIELMLVVAIIALLSAIAVPKFGGLIRRAQEAAVRGQLGAFRSALSIYYANNDGVSAKEPSSLTVGGTYLEAIPFVTVPIPEHTRPLTGRDYDDLSFGGYSVCCHCGSMPGMHIPWDYDLTTHELQINCYHMDSRGVSWCEY